MSGHLDRYAFSAVILLVANALPPSAVAADDGGTVYLKAGQLSAKTSQPFDGLMHEVDPYTRSTAAISFEKNLRLGFTLGFEALSWENTFTTPLNNRGEARTTMLQVIGRKYFNIKESRYHPFVGFGIGSGLSRYSYCNGLSCYRDSAHTLAWAQMGGIEVRFEHISITLEIKATQLLLDRSRYAFNPGGAGALLGIGHRW